jgi:hypothetical protein
MSRALLNTRTAAMAARCGQASKYARRIGRQAAGRVGAPGPDAGQRRGRLGE